MKFLWGTTLGAALVAYSVVAAGGRSALLFGAGVFAGSLISLWLCTFVGAGHPVKQGTGHHSPTYKHWSAGSGQQTSVSYVDVFLGSENGSPSSVRAPGLRRTLLLAHDAPGRGGLAQVGERPTKSRSANVPRSQPTTERGEERCQQKQRRGVKSTIVLSSVQQEVVSALMNLGCSMSQAQEAIRGSREGQSFDELFKLAMGSLNAGKSRRAA